VTNNYDFDAWYPSFMSPGCAAGHLGLSGRVFVLNGSPVGPRTFASRSFTIDPPPGMPVDADSCEGQ
jgi:hypothetical protein